MITHRSFTADFRPDIRQWLVWIPTAIGIGLLIGILVTFARLAFLPPRPSDAGSLPEPVVAVFPSTSPVATSSPRTPAGGSPVARTTVTVAAHGQGSSVPPHGVTPSPGPPVKAPGSRRPPKPRPTWSRTRLPQATPVTGQFAVFNVWDDGFIGGVQIGNDSDQPSDWVVELRFPDDVGWLDASWVEGAPAATMTRDGRTYIWHSGVPVGPRSTVPLRFQFHRHGDGMSPSLCTVNGTACRG